ncbi:hypothetical protein ASF60_09745 [Methylobacterium sp. Leaf113]|nr:hypothetical protein ASF60_09745 [Methylobacterium sp. Leaf113]
MADDAHLSAKDNIILKGGRTGDPHARDDDAVPTDDDVVGDLYKVIDLRPLPDDCIPAGPPVDRRIGTDFDIILDNDPADLRHLQVSPWAHRESKSVLAQTCAGMDNHPISDQRMGQRRTGPDGAVPSNANGLSDARIGADDRARANLRTRANDRTGIDLYAGLEACLGVDVSAGGDTGSTEE